LFVIVTPARPTFVFPALELDGIAFGGWHGD
jgi:hypothetical protein